MAGLHQTAWDCRDQEDRTAVVYKETEKRRQVEEENLKLKRLLREHGISWSPTLSHRTDFFGGLSDVGLSPRERVSRTSTRARTAAILAANNGPKLPAEILLRVVNYAMSSANPIVNPLSKSDPVSLTAKEYKQSRAGWDIAIGLMAVSRAFHVEAAKVFWGGNTFIFTTPEALLALAELSLETRLQIKSIHLRITARFYKDDSSPIVLSKRDHHNLPKDLDLPIRERPKGHSGAIGGLRSYAWLQVVDFLTALLPPFQAPPKTKKRKAGLIGPLPVAPALPRPRLLPKLDKMRIDLVNFPQRLLRSLPANDLHQMAAHELACTLSELTVTGFPCCPVGIRAAVDVSEMLRDNGLFIDGGVSYMQQRGARVQRVRQTPKFTSKIVRPRLPRPRKTADGADKSGDGEAGKAELGAGLEYDWLPMDNYHVDTHGHHRNNAEFDPLPVSIETDGEHSCFTHNTIWKQVPVSLQSEEIREWIEFEPDMGLPLDEVIWDSDDEDLEMPRVICPKCYSFHFDPFFDSD